MSPPALITATATLSFSLGPAGFSQKISRRVITVRHLRPQVTGSDLELRPVTPAGGNRGSLAQEVERCELFLGKWLLLLTEY